MSGYQVRKIEGWRSRLQREIDSARADVWGARASHHIVESGEAIVVHGEVRGFVGRVVQMQYHAERYEAQLRLKEFKRVRARYQWAERTEEQRCKRRIWAALWRATHRHHINHVHAAWRLRNLFKVQQYNRLTAERNSVDPVRKAKRLASQLAYRERRRNDINARQQARRASRSKTETEQTLFRHAVYAQLVSLAGLRYSAGGMGACPHVSEAKLNPLEGGCAPRALSAGVWVAPHSPASRLDKQGATQ